MKPRVRGLAAIGLIVTGLFATAAIAGEVAIEDVTVKKSAPGVFRFDVTLRHNDEGWEHYANKWEVVDPDGNVLGTRILTHPHVNEQPFRRGLANVKISSKVKQVTVRAYDNVHGLSSDTKTVDVPQ